MNAIEKGFRQAWAAGAAEYGITPDDYTPGEEAEIQRRVNEQFPYAASFSQRIVPQSQGGLLRDAMGQAELWVARYEEMRNAGRVAAAKDRPMEWVLGVAEHCSSCMKLMGKVKRGSWWRENGILPRQAGAEYLECRGFNCQCSLVPTDKGLTRGRMPSLP